MNSTSHTALLRDICLVAALCFLLLFWRLGEQPFYPSDESLHVKATQSMLHGGSLLVPTVDGTTYIKKPPFKMWLSLIPVSILGESSFSYRLTDAIAATATVLITYLLTRAIFPGSLPALIAVLALLGCRYFILYHCARNAVQDSMLVMLSTAIMWQGWKLTQGRGSILPIGLFSACAVLTKNVAGLLPIIFLAVGLIATGHFIPVIKQRTSKIILAGSVALILPGIYLMAVYLSDPTVFTSEMNREVVNRFAEGIHNSEDIWFYWKGLFLLNAGVQPLLLGGAGLLAIALSFRGNSSYRYLLAWSLFPLVLMTALPSRMPWYIAVAFPAMSILVGGLACFIQKWPFARRTSLALVVALLTYNIALNIAEIICPLSQPSWRQKNIYETKRPSLRLALIDLISDNHVKPISALSLSRSVQESDHEGIRPQIILYNIPSLAQHESIYFEALHPWKIGDQTELLKALAKSESTIVVAPLAQADEIRSLASANQFFSLPPENRFSRFSWHRRRTPLIALASTRDPSLSSFRNFNHAIDIASESLPILYGLHEIERIDAITFRRTKGPRAAFELSGDIFYLDRRTELKLIASLLPHAKAGSSCQLTLKFNEVDLGTTNITAREMNEYVFSIPPGSWNSSRNVVTLSIKQGDGSAIAASEQLLLLDNISINLP